MVVVSAAIVVVAEAILVVTVVLAIVVVALVTIVIVKLVVVVIPEEAVGVLIGEVWAFTFASTLDTSTTVYVCMLVGVYLCMYV